MDERRTAPDRRQTPNEYQIAGDHYRRANPEYQHWDLVADFNMNYYTGCLTKYVARWREKEGVKDLQKAVHYCEKLISLYSQQRGAYVWPLRLAPAPDQRMYSWCDGQRLTYFEQQIIELAVCYTDAADLDQLHTWLKKLVELASSTGQPTGSSTGSAAGGPANPAANPASR